MIMEIAGQKERKKERSLTGNCGQWIGKYFLTDNLKLPKRTRTINYFKRKRSSMSYSILVTILVMVPGRTLKTMAIFKLSVERLVAKSIL